MKSTKILAILIVGVVSVSLLARVEKPDKVPKAFEELWNALLDLQEQIDNIQLIPGPQGEPGAPGDSHWQLSGTDTYYNTGNVGIGTTSPSYKLDVHGDARVTDTINTDNSVVRSSIAGWLNVRTGPETEEGAILQVGGTTPYASTIYSKDTVGGWAFLGEGGSGIDVKARDGYSGYFEGGEGVIIYDGLRIMSGNVGIGTYYPAYKLDVEGDVQAKAYHTGDIFFQKDGQKLWRMFEDEDGLYLDNLKTGKVYTFVLQEREN